MQRRKHLVLKKYYKTSVEMAFVNKSAIATFSSLLQCSNFKFPLVTYFTFSKYILSYIKYKQIQFSSQFYLEQVHKNLETTLYISHMLSTKIFFFFLFCSKKSNIQYTILLPGTS